MIPHFIVDKKLEGIVHSVLSSQIECQSKHKDLDDFECTKIKKKDGLWISHWNIIKIANKKVGCGRVFCK